MALQSLYAVYRLDEPWVPHIESYVEQLRQDDRLSFMHFRDDFELHVSIANWRLPAEDVDDAVEAIECIASRSKPFQLTLRSVEFPRDPRWKGRECASRADRLWIFYEPDHYLIDLRGRLDRAVRGTFTPKRRMPHNTLAMGVQGRVLPVPFPAIPPCGLEGKATLTIDRFDLEINNFRGRRDNSRIIYCPFR